MNPSRLQRPSRLARAFAVVALASGLLAGACGACAQSLYDEKTFRSLTADAKAFRVGDIVTIQVIENAQASANADTGLKREDSGGASLRFRSAIPRAAGTVDINSAFDGGGQTARAGRLVAQLSVSVRDQLPNGDLIVSGEQLLVINDEQQRINIEGRIRVQDISDGNVVLSSRVADARITYVGEGDLAKRSRPGWWHYLLDLFGA